MNKTTRRATHWLSIALALTVFAGGLVPPGRAQNRAKSASNAARLQQQPQQQSPSKQTPDATAQAAPYAGDDFRIRTLAPEPPGKIAFASDRGGNFDIYVMDPDGGGIVRLTDDPAEDTQPTWSPDGTRIAFVSNRDGDKFEIYRANSDGTGTATRLTNNAFNDVSTSWPPGRITFQSDRDGNDEIYTINAGDGASPIRITNNAAFDIDPDRSSDGARVVWVSNRDAADNLEIYSAAADGSNVRRLTNNPASDTEPAVQPIPSGATLGTVQLSAATYTIGEGAGALDITVTRTGGTGAASVEIATFTGSASERNDFTTIDRTIRFAAGETSRIVRLSVINDLRVEGDETLNVTLSGAINTTVGTPSSAVVTITDNDTVTPTTNPLNSIEFFVRQQYLDFLGREPDQAGFNSWVTLLTNCPNQFNTDPNSPSAACDRIQVSASFFLSTEYQVRGSGIVRSYLAAFGRLPNFREFVRDLSAVGGLTDDEALANRARFPDDFVQRPEFGAIYDSLSNAAYVDALIANAAVTLPNRNQLVSDLNTGARTRAQAFSEIVNSTQFAAAAFNRSFVLTQYFGYLRRDPEPAGFNAWLTFLNANPTQFRTMVNGFLNSVEYRARFGQP